MNFIERAITVIITAGPKSFLNPHPISFGPNHENTLTLAGYRVSANISWGGNKGIVAAYLSIYGMNLADMNTIASIGQRMYNGNLNQVSILAGDANSGMSLVFQGTLQSAIVNTSASPQVSFDMTAASNYGLSMTPVPPSSFGGAADVATIMANLAKANGLHFENNGVNVVLSNPYFPGTALNQINSCARAANINFVIDPTIGPNGLLAIWPRYGSRGKQAVPVNAQNGMIGYPTYTNYGVDVDMLFNPQITSGSLIEVTSTLQPACGTWIVYAVNHNIESLTPAGDWMTSVETFDLGSYESV